jgi:hypothetical protein
VRDADVPVAAQYQAVVAAAADVADFCTAKRHRVVQTAPIAAVVVPGEPVAAADGVFLRSVGEERRHEIWRRVGTIPSASMAWNSPSVHDVARVQAALEIVSDLRPGDKEQPWPGEPWSIDRVVDSLRLLGPGPVRALGNWIEFPEHEPFLRRLLVSATVRPGPRFVERPDRDEVVAVKDPPLLVHVYNCLTAVASWPEGERHSYELAHNRFSQTYDRVNDEDRLIDSWIAFETLFLPKQDEGELSYRAQM